MTGGKRYLVDTNVMLRFLVQDDQLRAAAVKKVVEQARSGKITLEVPFMAIAETVHTLRTFYRVGMDQIAREMSNFLTGFGVRLTAPVWILDALEECQRRNVSFGDACIAAEARVSKLAVMSFDRDFDSMDGVTRYEPR